MAETGNGRDDFCAANLVVGVVVHSVALSWDERRTAPSVKRSAVVWYPSDPEYVPVVQAVMSTGVRVIYMPMSTVGYCRINQSVHTLLNCVILNFIDRKTLDSAALSRDQGKLLPSPICSPQDLTKVLLIDRNNYQSCL